MLSGIVLFDTVIALIIAVVITVGTLQVVMGSHKELMWPEKVACGHSSETVKGG
jgi:divalent metal cation (Fe/Co/Zn/Cd) transporter